MATPRAEREVATWNAEVSVGASVIYEKGDGKVLTTHTRSKAELLGNHTPVVWLEGVRGCVLLDRVTPNEE